VSAYLEEHRDRFGVEPVCSTLDVSASAYYQRRTGERSDRVIEGRAAAGGDQANARGELLRVRVPATWIALTTRRRAGSSAVSGAAADARGGDFRARSVVGSRGGRPGPIRAR